MFPLISEPEVPILAIWVLETWRARNAMINLSNMASQMSFLTIILLLKMLIQEMTERISFIKTEYSEHMLKAITFSVQCHSTNKLNVFIAMRKITF